MTYSDIIQSRENNTVHFPLWKLKVTDKEYQDLKKELWNHFKTEKKFDRLGEEAMLYMAEWFRRDYSDGIPSRSCIFDTLRPCNEDIDNNINISSGGNLLYKAAINAAKEINQKTKREIIQFVTGERNTMYFYSILYQGGLPLKKIVSQQNNGQVWNRAIRGMVWRNLDFSDTDLHITAANSDSVQMFCDQLVKAAQAKQYLLMPFYCENTNDTAYTYLTTEIERITKEQQVRQPFEIKWKFKIDEPTKKISVIYAINAPQRLDEDFLRKHNLQNRSVVSFGIRVGENDIPGPEFVNRRTFRPFHYEHEYDTDSEISVVLLESSKILTSDTLDLSEPHIIHQENDGNYYLGKGSFGEMKLLFNEEWKIEGESQYTEYLYGNESIFATVFSDDITLVNKTTNERKTFSSNHSLVWTECEFIGDNNPFVKQCVTRADVMRFYRCTDGQDRVNVRNNDVQFWNPNTKTWGQKPITGKCKVRVSDGSDGYATPTSFINFGSTIDIKIIESDKTTCKLSITWNAGGLTPSNGRRLANGNWLFTKEDLQEEAFVKCTCTPSDSNKSFTIHIHIPFKGFSIYDNYGKRVSPNSYIPYHDFQNYRYSVQDEAVKVSFGFINNENKIQFWKIQENGSALNSSGYLQAAVGGAALMRKLIEKQAQSVVFSNIVLHFKIGNNRTEDYFIKAYPYRFKRISCDEIIVCDSAGNTINYDGRIVLFPIDSEKEPFILRKNAEGKFILPLRLRNWNKTLFVSPQQRVLPGFEDLSSDLCLTQEQRDANRQNTKQSIQNELQDATICSDIWGRCCKWYDIWYSRDNLKENYTFPWSSILEYKYIAKDERALKQLILMLWLRCGNDEERNNLRQILLDNERDLTLQWYWLKRIDFQNDFVSFLTINMEDPETVQKLMPYMNPWAISQGLDRYLLCQNNPNECYAGFIAFIMTHFAKFWDELRYSSISKGIDINNNQRLFSADELRGFIDQGQATPIQINENDMLRQIAEDKGVILSDENEGTLLSFDATSQNRAPNERKFFGSVFLTAQHLRGNHNILQQELPIRACVLYYFATFPEYFIHFLIKEYQSNQ